MLPAGTVSESMMGSVDLVNSVSNEQRACAYRGSVEILAVCVRAQILLVSSAAFILGRFHVKPRTKRGGCIVSAPLTEGVRAHMRSSAVDCRE